MLTFEEVEQGFWDLYCAQGPSIEDIRIGVDYYLLLRDYSYNYVYHNSKEIDKITKQITKCHFLIKDPTVRPKKSKIKNFQLSFMSQDYKTEWVVIRYSAFLDGSI